MAFTYITSSGTWQAPLLVTGVMLIGCGGGGGGGCGHDSFSAGGGGGGGAWQNTSFVPVSALTTYTITIGAGGVGGISGGDQIDYCGQDGYATTFANGGTTLFRAIGGGGAGVNNNEGFNHGGKPWADIYRPAMSDILLEDSNYSSIMPGGGGSWNGSETAFNGNSGLVGIYTGGVANIDSGSFGAGGGGAGPQGNGGNGGSLASPNGQNASNNTGAGGGGGNTSSTNGGNGGSGYLYIFWTL